MDDILKQQEAEQAPPTSIRYDVDDIVADVRNTKTGSEELAVREGNVLAEGVDSEFWQIVKKKLNLRIQNLRSAGSLRLGEGKLDLQSIGLRAVIINEVADGFQDIINMVELSKKRKIAELASEEGEDNE